MATQAEAANVDKLVRAIMSGTLNEEWPGAKVTAHRVVQTEYTVEFADGSTVSGRLSITPLQA